MFLNQGAFVPINKTFAAVLANKSGLVTVNLIVVSGDTVSYRTGAADDLYLVEIIPESTELT